MSDLSQQAPDSTAASSSHLHNTPHTVSAGRGLSWLLEGWALLRKEPAVFIAMSLISLVAIFIINLIPVLGSFATALLWPAMLAGFFLAFKHAKHQQSVTANDLFEPFKAPASLIGVGAMYLLAGMAILLVMMIAAFLSAGSFSAIANGQVDMTQMSVGLVIILLLSIPASLAVAMAFAFAPVLVHQHQMPVIAAIKRSFAGSLRNILPFIVFFVVLTLCFIALSILMAIPLIGWLISVVVAVIYLPLFCGALFCAYSDIFLVQTHTEL